MSTSYVGLAPGAVSSGLPGRLSVALILRPRGQRTQEMTMAKPKSKDPKPLPAPTKMPMNKPAHLATDKHTAAAHVTPMHCP
jgi:hypothetical protein